jgi:putative tryptophan/tyrosine transport system substrate-binding protein
MSGKWLGLLTEVAPQIERVGFVMHPETTANLEFFKFAEAAAPALKVKPAALGVHDDDEIERAFASEGNGGIIVIPHAKARGECDDEVAIGKCQSAWHRAGCGRRLPALYPLAFYAEAGGLISYGFNTVDQFQRGAEYAS